MEKTRRILIQTTTPARPDDWSVDSLSLLAGRMAAITENGFRFEVSSRNREAPPGEDDPLLSRLDESDFDELWLFALDAGDGLTEADCAGITRFRRRGGGLLTSRDHQNMGASLCGLGGVGLAHFFQTRNPEPDAARHEPDDRGTPSISWPNYHSGSNGDFQRIEAIEPFHELLANPDSPSGRIEVLPAHPHEGAVGVPVGAGSARVIARGRSLATGRPFNLAVAFEGTVDRDGHELGRAIADSSFHHFADYNWDPRRPAPSFVTETPGDGMLSEPRALDDVHRYVRNLAVWLAPAPAGVVP